MPRRPLGPGGLHTAEATPEEGRDFCLSAAASAIPGKGQQHGLQHQTLLLVPPFPCWPGGGPRAAGHPWEPAQGRLLSAPSSCAHRGLQLALMISVCAHGGGSLWPQVSRDAPVQSPGGVLIRDTQGIFISLQLQPEEPFYWDKAASGSPLGGGGCAEGVCRGLCPRACAHAHWWPGDLDINRNPDCPLPEPSPHFSFTITASVTDGPRMAPA